MILRIKVNELVLLCFAKNELPTRNSSQKIGKNEVPRVTRITYHDQIEPYTFTIGIQWSLKLF